MADTIPELQVRAFVKLKPLLSTVASSQLAASFDQMTKLLHGAPFSGTARFTLVSDPQPQSFTISIHEGSAKVDAEAEKVDFEIVTTPETWLAIAEGNLAPLDAFMQGKMRVRGDYKLGQRIMKRLAASDGRTDFC
jgi:putative sterol carrier protein